MVTKARPTQNTEKVEPSVGLSHQLRMKLCSMKEDQLTQQVLGPLFEAFGYDKVEFYGGADEEGKDLVGWKRDETGRRPWLGVMQVKKLRFARKASAPTSFSTIVNQLCQCVEKALPHPDGHRYLPDVVYFVTPYDLPTKILNTRIERVTALKGRVTILEGTDLCKLLIERLPKLVDGLVGTHLEISQALTSTLTNQQLLSALHVDAEKHVKSFYLDIDLQIGTTASHDFFLLHPEPIERSCEFDSEEWHNFQLLLQRCAELGANITRESVADVNADREHRVQDLARWYDQESAARARVQEQRKAVRDAERALDGARGKLSSLQKKLNEIAVANVVGANRETLQGQAQNLEATCGSLERQVRATRELLEARTTEHEVIVKMRPSDKYQVTVLGKPLADSIIAERSRIEAMVRRYNRKPPTDNELRDFVERCFVLSGQMDEMLHDRTALEILGISNEEHSVPGSPERERLCIPLGRLIDTGANLWVFGDAGAGKTTTLQYYAWSCLSDRLAVYIPLSRLVRTRPFVAVKSTSNASGADRIRDAVVAYLDTLGVATDGRSLVMQLLSRRGVLLFDGVDEAIGKCPGILADIKKFMIKTPQIQVVVSSRVSGKLLSDPMFLGISLLPFTDDQRDRFVSAWFSDAGQETAKRVLKHCARTRTVAEVVSTPLNATILCVLAERGLPLPRSEAHLHRSRLDLLFTEYDLHKGVQRVRSDRATLETVARKIAYWLHSRNVRDARLDEFVPVLERLVVNLPTSVALQALHELVTPCNVLVPMTEDGRLGFGHLRYQEFLVALELLGNRGADVASRLDESWWHGALHLMAEMSGSLKWLVDAVVQENTIAKNAGILADLFRVGPRSERGDNMRMLHSFCDEERLEELVCFDPEDG